jgi:branched-chain amino acid aminotransferase
MTGEEDERGVHDYLADPRNAEILICVNGSLKRREEAVVSVFESGFLLGDGVWEGLRVMEGGVAFLPEHLKRLYAGAKAIDMDIGLTKAELTARLMDCLKANGMTHGVHVRLMVTRGIKKTPYQGPRFTIGKATIVIIPEYKTPLPSVGQKGVSLFTVHVRRTGPAEQDQKLNSHSKLNCILACIQAEKAGADEALMLDPAGFVATCNSTHFFIVRDGEVWTSPPEYCLGGITRGNILKVCRNAGIPAIEKRFSLFDVYAADEAFITGTFAGVTPVREVDGRSIEALDGPVSARVRELYRALQRRSLTSIV